MTNARLFSICVALAGAAPAAAQAPSPAASPTPVPPTRSEVIQVTATRVPEAVDVVPGSIQVVTGDELRSRNARDLEEALALVPGVAVAPGGDGGPAASVPELWGLREFDAFLLVVDGVPWGGAFNPALASLDLSDVERIEVQHGPAPVMYGATSFVGVVHVVRRAPSEQRGRLALSGGSYGSGRGSVSTPLPRLGALESAIAADFQRLGFRDERTGVDRGHALWRGRRTDARGSLRVDLDATWLRQEPASPAPRQGATLSPRVPLDANHNPAGAALDEDRYFAAVGYDRAFAFADLSTAVSFARTTQRQRRGFLLGIGGDPAEAAGFDADIDQDDVYFDSHLSWTRGARLRAVVGVDLLHGRARAAGETFDYAVRLDGSSPSTPVPGEERRIGDRRDFAGAYANFEWTPSSAWRVDLGVRLNRTEEERGEGGAGEAEAQGGEEEKREVLRPSGGVGVTWTAWSDGGGLLRVFGNWKNAFKPAAIDFNLAEDPAAEGEAGILEPETSNSFELGARTELLDRRLNFEVSAFRMDLEQLVVSQSIGGLPALANAGGVRLQGVELSAAWRLGPHFFARGTYSHHDARFRDYLTQFDGVPTQVAGNRFEMSPRDLAALSLTWAPEHGLLASADVSYSGSRYLNKRNTALAPHYATLGAVVGYRTPRWELLATGRNLTDRRDPVAESELGDAQYYRQFPRRLEVSAGVRF